MNEILDPLILSRWQFGLTTIYHFLFVPLTIGLSALVALMETIWLRTGREDWLRLTKFIGKLFLINIAMGVLLATASSTPVALVSQSCSALFRRTIASDLALQTRKGKIATRQA